MSNCAGPRRNTIEEIQIGAGGFLSRRSSLCGRSVDVMDLRVASPTPDPPYCEQAAASGGVHPISLVFERRSIDNAA
ncbi:hypothetical protein X743_21935 [Mesorhizobium sp. LNHC252B00]|nr:hypothetical protein X743_21935 [Mesorhizobium sp. LNHC252B00]